MYSKFVVNDILILSIMILIVIIVIFIVCNITSQFKEGFKEYMNDSKGSKNVSIKPVDDSKDLKNVSIKPVDDIDTNTNNKDLISIADNNVDNIAGKKTGNIGITANNHNSNVNILKDDYDELNKKLTKSNNKSSCVLL